MGLAIEAALPDPRAACASRPTPCPSRRPSAHRAGRAGTDRSCRRAPPCPARAPASIDMLQTVKRPSMLRPRMVEPAYSMTWPVPPAAPILAMIARMTSLACTPGASAAVDRDAHVLRLGLPQRLRRQHMGDLGGADAEGERADRAMRRRVAVAANYDHSGLAQALLGPDHMHDALPAVLEAEQRHAGRPRVSLEILDHGSASGLIDGGEVAAKRRYVMVGRRERTIGTTHRQVPLLKHAESIARSVMHEMAIDVQQRRAIQACLDHMRGPDLIEHCRGSAHRRLALFRGLGSLAAGASVRKRWLTASHSSAPTRRKASRTVMAVSSRGCRPCDFNCASSHRRRR